MYGLFTNYVICKQEKAASHKIEVCRYTKLLRDLVKTVINLYDLSMHKDRFYKEDLVKTVINKSQKAAIWSQKKHIAYNSIGKKDYEFGYALTGRIIVCQEYKRHSSCVDQIA
jgi:hypothetical protein